MDDGQRDACIQVHKALMACKHAKSFLEPVDWVALKIPTYPEIITHPMDLGTIQTKLNEGKYSQSREWEQDVRLVVANAKIFNVPDSIYYKMAEQLEAFFDKRLPKLNKELQLWSSLTDVSAHPDWRERGARVLSELKAMPEAAFFLQPVDWKALNLPDYPIIIKQPMDLSTATQKLLEPAAYRCPADLVHDVWLIWKNAFTYNRPESAAAKMAKRMADAFRHKFVKAFQNEEEEDGSGATKRRKLSMSDKITITELEKSSSVADYEYINLRESLAQLDPDALQRTVLVAQEKNVSSVETSMESVTLNLDLLAPADFRFLAKYVALCKKG